MLLTVPPRLALIACRVLEAEVNHFLPAMRHVVRTEFLEVGLHDRPDSLRRSLVAALARAEDDPQIEAVALVYGVCGMGTIGLAPRRCTLVLPRAHDCLTLFLGSKERYADIMRRAPDLYWYTPGWNRARRVPGPEREAALREEYTAKFGAEDAEALLQMEREAWHQHTRAAFTDHGLPGREEEKRYAEKCAAWLGWSCSEETGDASLLRALLAGEWDATRFLVVTPGRQTAFSPDEHVIKSAPNPSPAPGDSAAGPSVSP